MSTKTQSGGRQSHKSLSHTHVVVGEGTGKSTVLKALIRREIMRGHGVMVVNPHAKGEKPHEH